MKLEVDGFEIDLETLDDATKQGASLARWAIVEEVVKNLDPESKRRFEEYQAQP